MKNKSLAVQILTMIVAVIGSYGALFSTTAQAWLGIVSFAITVLLQSPILSTGTWPVGWNKIMWISNGAGIVIQVLNAISDKGLVDPATINYVIVGINILLVTFIKDYGNTSTVAAKSPCE